MLGDLVWAALRRGLTRIGGRAACPRCRPPLARRTGLHFQSPNQVLVKRSVVFGGLKRDSRPSGAGRCGVLRSLSGGGRFSTVAEKSRGATKQTKMERLHEFGM